ncbi:MAG: NAD(P)H-dependent oxidoreductase [Rhizobiaceae bacterium]|nr:NAD(P)H-dependent oxidoreductase [Rhizobiaceae bacterium]
MRVLVVLAHPLGESFAASVARTSVAALEDRGHEVDFLDLYAENFDPRLTAAERAGYMSGNHDVSAVSAYTRRLEAADALILVFPQWWFNLPAILKGFIDRVFTPGVAFDYAADGIRLEPKLDRLRHFWVFSTTGSPWWVVKFYMGDPVRRQLKRGIAAFCGRRVDFRMTCLHDMDNSSAEKRRGFLARIGRDLGKL